MKIHRPAPEYTINAKCAIGKHLSIEIELENLHDNDMQYNILHDGLYLSSKQSVTIKSKEKQIFIVDFNPVELYKATGRLAFIDRNDQVDEFWYCLNLESTDPSPIELPVVICPSGKCNYELITIGNPSDFLITARASISNSIDFRLISPPLLPWNTSNRQWDCIMPLKIPPKSSIQIQVAFLASDIGLKESSLTIDCNQIGKLTYVIKV